MCLHKIDEYYKIRDSQIRLISGSFLGGKESVKWRGQEIGTFNVVDGKRVVQWAAEPTLTRVLGADATSMEHPWNYDTFIANWNQYVTTRASSRN